MEWAMPQARFFFFFYQKGILSREGRGFPPMGAGGFTLLDYDVAVETPPRATNTQQGNTFRPGRSPKRSHPYGRNVFLCGVLVAWGGCGPARQMKKIGRSSNSNRISSGRDIRSRSAELSTGAETFEANR